nr:hypothetical protein [Acidobacteriota bacterium]
MKLRFSIFSFGFIVGAIMLCAAVAQAQNWPSFRGLNASGVADGKSTPTSWDVEKNTNVAWKVEIPGLAHAS